MIQRTDSVEFIMLETGRLESDSFDLKTISRAICHCLRILKTLAIRTGPLMLREVKTRISSKRSALYFKNKIMHLEVIENFKIISYIEPDKMD